MSRRLTPHAQLRWSCIDGAVDNGDGIAPRRMRRARFVVVSKNREARHAGRLVRLGLRTPFLRHDDPPAEIGHSTHTFNLDRWQRFQTDYKRALIAVREYGAARFEWFPRGPPDEGCRWSRVDLRLRHHGCRPRAALIPRIALCKQSFFRHL